MRTIIILFTIYFQLFAQEDKSLYNDHVIGLISSDEGVYLELENGYIQLNKNDVWEEYYRTIYNDSTIINPNTEIIIGNNLTIIPYLIPSTNINSRIDFSEPFDIGLFFKLNENNNYDLTNYGHSILDSLLKN